MGAIFQSLGRTVLAGFVVLAVIIIAAGGAGAKAGDHAWWSFVFRWLHVMSGVMWIGLLWYFNFVQTPSMPKIPDEQKPAVSKVIAPTALFWFRWAALATVVTGLIVAGMSGYLVSALMLTKGVHAIGIGMWLGAGHGVQRVVHHLAEPEEGAGHRSGVARGEGRRGEAGRHDLAHQHHAVHTDAVLHGRAAERRIVIR